MHQVPKRLTFEKTFVLCENMNQLFPIKCYFVSDRMGSPLAKENYSNNKRGKHA